MGYYSKLKVVFIINSIVINLFAGPGVGKSLVVADLFQRLKRNGYSCDFIYETAKELVWDNKIDDLKNQIWIAQEQYRKINRLIGKVNIILVDSPLLLGSVYQRYREPNELLCSIFDELLINQHKTFDNLNIYLERLDNINFEDSGRADNLEESLKLDKLILNMLDKFEINHIKSNSSIEGVDYIYDLIVNNYLYNLIVTDLEV